MVLPVSRPARDPSADPIFATDPQRRENLEPDELGVWLPGELFNDSPEDEKAEIGIGDPRAGIEIEPPVEHIRNDRGGRRRKRHSHRGCDLPAQRRRNRIATNCSVPAAGVRKQIPDRNPPDPRIAQAPRTRAYVGKQSESANRRYHPDGPA